MRIAVLGTGVVGQTLAGKLAALGHDVVMGTRDAEETRGRTAQGAYGNPPMGVWLEEHPMVRLASFADAAASADVILNATNGHGSLDALRLAGEQNLNGKLLLDISNPLDFSRGMPPTLSVCNTDSLGEQIQRGFPNVKVVKTLNTVTASLMVNPAAVNGGDHAVFVSGSDSDAKARTADLLREWFGWQEVIDLGDISSARGVEMYLPLWLRLWGAMGSGVFNIKIVK